MTLGQRIQELRKQAGLSQEGLGEALGVSRQAVSKWESDGGIPELDTLIAMSRLFGITVGQLLGVETPEEREEAPETTSGFTEEQVEDILRRYVEETRPPKETPASWLAKWGWVPAAAIVVVTVLVVLFAQLSSLRTTVKLLRGEVSTLQVDVSNRMNNLSGTIRESIYDILAEEAELLNTFTWSLESFDLEAETVTLSLEATLKEYPAGSTMQFILDYVEDDQTGGQVCTGYVEGPNFKAEITLPLNFHTEVSIRLMDTDGNLQEQFVEYIYSLSGENFQLECYNLRVPFKLKISRFGAVSEMAVAEEAYIDIYTNHPGQFWPENARLTAWVNGEKVFSEEMALTQSGDDQGLYLAAIAETYYEVSLKEGDVFEVQLVTTDNLGRVQEVRQTGTVKDGELDMPMTAPATQAD